MSMSSSPGMENMDEFDEPKQLKTAFCSQMTEEEYDEQTTAETQKALKQLMDFIDKDPQAYMKVLQRRKRDEEEDAGILSYLKVKVMSMLNGGVNPSSAISEEELSRKMNELKTGMQKAFDYSREAKGRRYSKRLAERRMNIRVLQQDENCPIPVAHVTPTNSRDRSLSVPPPPPPPPPPIPPMNILKDLVSSPIAIHARTPLKDINSQEHTSTPNPDRSLKPKSILDRVLWSAVSTSSLNSLNSELNSSNPMKRLRATGLNKSPGGTPVRRRKAARRESGANIASLNYEEPLHVAFMNILERKFRNVRSPSPARRVNSTSSPASPFNNAEFTP